MIDRLRRPGSGDVFSRPEKPAANKPVHGKCLLGVLCALSSLLRDFRRSAADRLALADARANRVDRRPLGEMFRKPLNIPSRRPGGWKKEIGFFLEDLHYRRI
jgi:hypothetical protein